MRQLVYNKREMLALLRTGTGTGAGAGIGAVSFPVSPPASASPPFSSSMRFSSAILRREARTDSQTSDSRLLSENRSPAPSLPSSSSSPSSSSPSPSPSPSSFYVYCLLSADLCRTYVGVTSNLHRRIRQHNGEIAGGAKASRSGRPWKIICTVQGFPTYSEACKFEWKWKDVSKRMYAKHPSVQDETIPRDSLFDSPSVHKRKRALDRVRSSNDWQCLNIEWHLSHENS